MLHASNLVLISILLVNLAGLSWVAYRLSGSWLLARAASPLLVAIPFFLEHYFGFGSLSWVLPISTVASAALILRHSQLFKKYWRIETVFHSAFAYALAWRYAFPDIDQTSEKITDLTMIANYIHGDRLPPVDRWLPPFPFDMYYSLQHYAAALLGRVLEVPPGAAYNLAVCVLAASVVTAAAGTAWLLVRRRGPTLLLTLVLIFGGTGVSPVIHLVTPSAPLHGGIRFLGTVLSPAYATKPFGKWLLNTRGASGPNAQDLPVELFSYLLGLGDCHPPLSGYLLLMVALLSIAMIESGENTRAAHVVLAATVPLTIAANAWDFPLQAFLVAAFLLYRVMCRKPVDGKALAWGGAVAMLLIYPFLIRFGPQTDALHNALRWVPHGFHTPPVAGLLVFYPVLAILALSLLFGERTPQSLAFTATWLILLAASEFLFIDDVYSDSHERFNTALKWWAWIYSGTLLMVGAVNLRSPSRLCRWGTAAVLTVTLSFAADLGSNLARASKPHVGQLDGAAWLRDDPAQRSLLDFLRAQPPSIVLERLPERAYIAAPALTIFSLQTAFLGWPNHEDIWRGYRPDIDHRLNAIDQFYAGELPDAARWLEQNRIRYVLWVDGGRRLPAEAFDRIDRQISGSYQWIDHSVRPGWRAGIWSRISGE